MSLLKNSTIVMSGVVATNIFAYGFHFIAARMLGPDAYGEFGALIALLLMMILPAGAIGAAITKYTARYSADNQNGKITILRNKIQKNVLVISGIILLIIIAFSKIIADYMKIPSVIPIIIIGFSMVFALLLPINRGVLQGLKMFQVLSINSVLEAFIRILLLAALLFNGLGVNGALISYGLSSLVAFFIIFPYLKGPKNEITEYNAIEIKPIYRFAFHVFIITIVLQSIQNIPSIFIKHYYTDEFTGNWTAALNLARLSLFITGAISSVMFPEIVREKEVHVKRKIFYKATLLVCLVTSAMAIIFIFLPELLIKMLYGKDYLEAVPILKWMGFAMIPFGLLQLRMDYFLASLK
ncbi:MAG: oligosaccharide flippase family protein [Bacteroidota bacterium]